MPKGIVKGSGFVRRLGAQFVLLNDGSVTSDVIFDEAQEGPPGHVHGGALATLLDEAMGAAAWLSGKQVAAAHLGFDYKLPIPLGVSIRISGRVERQEGRKVFTTGAVTLANGEVAVIGSGIFVEAPKLFEDSTLGFGILPALDE